MAKRIEQKEDFNINPIMEEAEIETEVKAEEIEPVLMKNGKVAGCKRLNVRTEPNINAEVLCVIKCSAKVEIDELESTGDFYKVYLENGFDGFCMKKFIDVE